MKPDDFCWERATWYTGVMAAYKRTGDEKFLNQALDWGQKRQWQVCIETSLLNVLFGIQTWAELSLIKHDRVMLEPSIQWFNKNVGNAPPGAKVWYLEDGVPNADSHDGASGLAMLAKATGDPKYLDYLHAFFWDVEAELFDKEAGLFDRKKRFIGQASKNGKKVFWSRGNGWVVGGIVRILQYLPQDDPYRPRYVELLKTMAAAIAKCQGLDGRGAQIWRMLASTACRRAAAAVSFATASRGALTTACWTPQPDLPVVQKAWTALTRVVNQDGKVQWGQPAADRPWAVKQEDTYEYVTGAFLLAGSEMSKLGDPAK